MKTILVAAVTINGQVALADKKHHQSPEAVFGAFFRKAAEAGNIILGKNTYRMLSHFSGAKELMASLEVVVLSRTEPESADYTVVSTPEQALEHLSRKGFETAFIGGGVQTYNAFLEADLVTDIYFSLLPIVTGDGGPLRINDGKAVKFKLAEQTMITKGVEQLHFSKS